MNFSSAIKVWKCGAFYVPISFFRFLQIFRVIFLDIDQNFCFQGELAVKVPRIANKKELCVGNVGNERSLN